MILYEAASWGCRSALPWQVKGGILQVVPNGDVVRVRLPPAKTPQSTPVTRCTSVVESRHQQSHSHDSHKLVLMLAILLHDGTNLQIITVYSGASRVKLLP